MYFEFEVPYQKHVILSLLLLQYSQYIPISHVCVFHLQLLYAGPLLKPPTKLIGALKNLLYTIGSLQVLVWRTRDMCPTLVMSVFYLVLICNTEVQSVNPGSSFYRARAYTIISMLILITVMSTLTQGSLRSSIVAGYFMYIVDLAGHTKPSVTRLPKEVISGHESTSPLDTWDG